MEIKLSAGDRINIPENCQARIEDNQIIIKEQNEELKEEFKDGDILRSVRTGAIVIFKSYVNEITDEFESYYNNCNESNLGWGAVNFLHATEEEKQHFFDELKAKGLRWNTETKTMESIRERAKKGERYLYIDNRGKVLNVIDFADSYDDVRFETGNYYLPEEIGQAEQDAKFIRAIFEKRLKV
jgi:hypothetical protein